MKKKIKNTKKTSSAKQRKNPAAGMNEYSAINYIMGESISFPEYQKIVDEQGINIFSNYERMFEHILKMTENRSDSQIGDALIRFNDYWDANQEK